MLSCLLLPGSEAHLVTRDVKLAIERSTNLCKMNEKPWKSAFNHP